jgi:hypothetical protein
MGSELPGVWGGKDAMKLSRPGTSALITPRRIDDRKYSVSSWPMVLLSSILSDIVQAGTDVKRDNASHVVLTHVARASSKSPDQVFQTPMPAPAPPQRHSTVLTTYRMLLS